MGIDHIDELVNDSVKNLKKDESISRLLESGRIKMVVGDGRRGHPSLAPYNAIHVGAAAPEIPQAVGCVISRRACMEVCWLSVVCGCKHVHA